MQIIDYSHTKPSTASKDSTFKLIETFTAAMIFLLPALLLFILSSGI